jgi:hypothetical protein
VGKSLGSIHLTYPSFLVNIIVIKIFDNYINMKPNNKKEKKDKEDKHECGFKAKHKDADDEHERMHKRFGEHIANDLSSHKIKTWDQISHSSTFEQKFKAGKK